MTKSVVWSSCARLSCSNQETPEVVLCLTDSSLLAPFTCPDETESSFAFTTIDAVLTKSWKDCGSCGTGTYRYLFQYDENLLADPTTPLVTADVAGVFCKGCLTDWVEEKVGDEIQVIVDEFAQTVTIISQHGCSTTFSIAGAVS
jgi:hypothetical protein